MKKKSRKKGGQNPPRFRHHFVYLLTYYVFIISLSLKYANLMIMSGNNHTLKINLTTKYGERKKWLAANNHNVCAVCNSPSSTSQSLKPRIPYSWLGIRWRIKIIQADTIWFLIDKWLYNSFFFLCTPFKSSGFLPLFTEQPTSIQWRTVAT